MKLSELARKIKSSKQLMTKWARDGKFKTARKEPEAHSLPVWHIDDEEADEIIK